WKIGSDIDERDAPILGAEEPCGVVTPCRCQHDLCLSLFQDRKQPGYQLRFSDVGELARIRRPFAVEDAIDVRKNDFHGRRVWAGCCPGISPTSLPAFTVTELTT